MPSHVCFFSFHCFPRYQELWWQYCKEQVDGGNKFSKKIAIMFFHFFLQGAHRWWEKFCSKFANILFFYFLKGADRLWGKILLKICDSVFPHRDGVRVKLKNGRKGASCHLIPISDWSSLWHCYDNYKEWDLVFGLHTLPKVVIILKGKEEI